MTDRDIVLTTCPRDCYDACGIAVERRDGAIHRVLGDRDHPVSRGALCPKCALAYNGAWRDPAARLSTPLRRAGPKGAGRFEPVSWEQALEEIARGLHATLRRLGPAGVLHAHYTGTCSLLAGEFPMRFFNRLGATEVTPDTICNQAGHVALEYLYGTSTEGFDPATARDSACILVWGANPSASGPHVDRHWLGAWDAQVIVVDPVRHATARRADLHLQPFPGSDAALAFAMLHVARREGLCDGDFLRDHCLGWEELEPLLGPCTPEWGERLTGVPAALIEDAATRYARGPSLLWLGQGLQRQPTGGNVVRACALLPAVTGNLGRPGAGFCYLNHGGPRPVDGDHLCASHLRREPAREVSHMDLADHLADPARTGAFLCWNMNVAASAPRQQALRAALAREDLFTVVVDLFATDTADLADVVLPAASFLEFDDLVLPYFHLLLSAQVKAAEPPGEALPNPEIFRRLATAMGYPEPELQEPDREIIDTVLARSGLGVDFDTLRAAGTVAPFSEPRVQFADRRFSTPSGRVEIASAAAERDGHPRLPRPVADPRPGAGRLRLLSPASDWLLNDSYGNDARVAAAMGPPRVHLNPEDMARLGIEEGARAVLHNRSGALEMVAAASADVLPGVALAHKGRWPKLDAAGGNVNRLNTGARTDMGDSSAVHGLEVAIRPAGET